MNIYNLYSTTTISSNNMSFVCFFFCFSQDKGEFVTLIFLCEGLDTCLWARVPDGAAIALRSDQTLETDRKGMRVCYSI